MRKRSRHVVALGNGVRIISWVFKSPGGKAEAGVSTQRHGEISIFTVASGLLYEVRSSSMLSADPRGSLLTYFPEVHVDYDPERAVQHKAHCEVLVH
jgi:hypothetical protein